MCSYKTKHFIAIKLYVTKVSGDSIIDASNGKE